MISENTGVDVENVHVGTFVSWGGVWVHHI